MVAFPAWAAIRTVKERIGTWKGFERYREIDPTITREQWSTAIGDARAALAGKVLEITKSLNRLPTPNEMTPYHVVKSSGYMQQVEVFVKDRDTGLIETRFWSLKTDTLRSRGWAVNKAIDAYTTATQENPEDYPEEILGAVYTGTRILTPRT